MWRKKKEEKKSEYVERWNMPKTIREWDEMDCFENLTAEQNAIVILIKENARLKEEIDALRKWQGYNFRA